uniref:Uncharacterized protein n=1 Tax=Anguilla anguilla TaxID=7936 RepID=A0A0E9TYI2_ANGAN
MSDSSSGTDCYEYYGVGEHPSLLTIYEESVFRPAQKIVSDPTHIFYPKIPTSTFW